MSDRISAETIVRKGFEPLDLRDGPVDESRVQFTGPPVIGVHPGQVLLRDANGAARALVYDPPLRLLVYRAPILPEVLMAALPGRPVSDLLDRALIAAAGLDPDCLLDHVGMHSTPWDGPQERLAERAVRTLVVELRPAHQRTVPQPNLK